jgi:ABC-type polysaccharide/polyol phosphate export permease
MKTLMDTLYIAWIIGTKDILDALKYKSTRYNLVIMVGMVVFFYWLGILRPFDKDVSVVMYDQGQPGSNLETVTMMDGARYSFRRAVSLEDMQTKMANQSLGLMLPADLKQTLASGGTPTLNGYIFWVDRMKVTELEAKYTQAFTEILGQPVRVVIGENIIIPQANAGGDHRSLSYLLVYFVFITAMTLIPHLVLEERQTRTLDALSTSPASAVQIVLGKALAGFFYVLLIGGVWVALNYAYIVNWGIALVAFLGYALFAIGLALILGSLITSMWQVGIWGMVIMLLLVIPAIFYMDPNLKAGIRVILTWFPSSALASLLRFSCSTGVTPSLVWPNLAVVVASIAIVFGLVIWKVRRSDR